MFREARALPALSHLNLPVSRAPLLAEVVALRVDFGVAEPVLTILVHVHLDRTNTGLEDSLTDVELLRLLLSHDCSPFRERVLRSEGQPRFPRIRMGRSGECCPLAVNVKNAVKAESRSSASIVT